MNYNFSMKITDVYKKYNIMPNLQTHQLRVASVSKLIIDNLTEPITDKKEILTASLLHDMGNIIKFDLTVFPEFLEPEGFEYWNNIRTKFLEKYGDEEHEATEKIAKELNVDDRTYELITSVGFTRSEQVLATNDISSMICLYSDQRVGPRGILSIDYRFEEGNKRYKNKYDDSKSNSSFDFLKKIEEFIFTKCKIHPEDITDEAIEGVMEELKELEVN